MFENIDKEISKRIKHIMESKNVKGVTISNWLDLRASSVSDMLNGRSPWRIKHLVIISIQFGMSLEELIFGDPEFCKNLYESQLKEQRNYLKNALNTYSDNSEFKKKVYDLFELNKIDVPVMVRREINLKVEPEEAVLKVNKNAFKKHRTKEKH